MKFGVFDHLDASGAPLAEFYENRLRLAEAYDRIGIHALHIAEHHATPLGMSPSPVGVPVGGRAAHEAPALRAAGLHARALPSAAPGRRDLHARPAERRALRARRRPRRVADRDRVLRLRPGEIAGHVPRGLPGDPAGADRWCGRHADLRGQLLPVQGRAAAARAAAAPAPADLVRPVQSGERRIRRRQQVQRRQQRGAEGGARDHRPLPRRVGEEGQRPGAAFRSSAWRGTWSSPIPTPRR